MPVWRRLQDEGAGFLWSLSESLAIVEWRNPSMLHSVSDGMMVVASDYSGQHKGASHEAYTFIVTTDRALENWLPLLLEFRRRWLPDGRRLSFKALREPMRWHALGPFLEIASAIRGNLIAFLVDHRVESFMAGGASALADVFPDCFVTERPGTIEKMFRLASFLGMVTAGFRREQQRSLWISDHDETLATFERREQFGNLASYLTFGCARWLNPADMYFGTTESTLAPRWAEDLSSVCDLCAGAYCALSRLLPTNCGRERWVRRMPSSAAHDRRARAIGDWLATSRGNLRHVLLRLDIDSEGHPHASAQFFLAR